VGFLYLFYPFKTINGFAPVHRWACNRRGVRRLLTCSRSGINLRFWAHPALLRSLISPRDLARSPYRFAVSHKAKRGTLGSGGGKCSSQPLI